MTDEQKAIIRDLWLFFRDDREGTRAYAPMYKRMLESGLADAALKEGDIQ